MSEDSTVAGVGQKASPTLPDSEIRRNTVLLVFNGALMQMAMAFASADTVLPAFVQQLTTSTFLIGLAGSLMRIGWAWPQVFISRLMEPVQRKMPLFLTIGSLRAIIWFGIAFLAFRADLITPWLLLAFLVLYGISTSLQGVTNVPWMDIIGKSVPSSHRARMFAIRRLVGGALAVGAGGVISFALSDASGLSFPSNYGLLFLLDGSGTALSISSFGFIREPIEPPSRARESLRNYLKSGLLLIRDDVNFRRLCVVQVLWAFGMMGAPFYVPYAVSEFGLNTAYVGMFVAVLQFSSIFSNVLWAYLGHRYGNRTLLIGGSYLLGASLLVPLLTPLVPETPMGFSVVPGEALTMRTAFYSATFVVMGFAMSGVFTGRMTYVLDIAPPGRRPTYTSFLNMSMLPQGMLPMLAGVLVSYISYPRMFMVALAVTPVAAVLSHRLKDVEEPR